MATTPAAPVEALAAVHEAEGRLLGVVAGFDDEFVAGPSQLPGWTVGHLITHLARNADSHTRRTAAAIDGVMVDQYPGGMIQRTSEIDAGAARSARALHADLADACGRLLAAWDGVPDYAWANVSTSWTWGPGSPTGTGRRPSSRPACPRCGPDQQRA